MKQSKLVISLVLFVGLTACSSQYIKESDQPIERKEGASLQKDVQPLIIGNESIERHRLIRMSGDFLLFEDYSLADETDQTSRKTDRIYSYNLKTQTTNDIISNVDQKLYQDFIIFHNHNYALYKDLNELSQPTDEMKLSLDGTDMSIFNSSQGLSYFKIDKEKLYYINSTNSGIYVSRIKNNRMIGVRHPLLNEIKEYQINENPYMQPIKLGKQYVFLNTNEKESDLDVMSSKGIKRYKMPSILNLLGLFGDDVFIQNETGVYYYNLDNQQMTAVEGLEGYLDYECEGYMQFTQISETQGIFQFGKNTKLFTYRDDGSYMMQDLYDEPLNVVSFDENKVIL